MVWIGLEVNLLSFIPLLAQLDKHQETEAIVKYFLAQAVGSIMLLLGGLLSMSYYGLVLGYNIFRVVILAGLLIKMGAAPFHFWFPRVIASLS